MGIEIGGLIEEILENYKIQFCKLNDTKGTKGIEIGVVCLGSFTFFVPPCSSV